MMRDHALLFITVALGLSACASRPDIAPQATLRDAASLGLSAAQHAAMPEAQWWREFDDPQLNRLVEVALASSPSLKIAQARLARAQAAAALTDAAGGPQLAASVDATRQHFTANGMIPPPLAGAIYTTATAQLTGSWELDFFGKNRAALQAALGNARAAQAEADAARTLLASQVARSYFQLARLNDQLALAQLLLAQREQVQALVQERVNAGLDTQLELRQSETQLPQARLQIQTLQEQMTLVRHALGALIGQPDGALALVPSALSAIKQSVFSAAVPSDLLGRRADIVAARWRVEAATQELGSAKAQFYPNVNLVAFAGFSSIGLDRLLGAGSEQWGIGPALRLPLFDAGRLRANLRGKSAELDAAIESYNAAVIDAVRDASDQIASGQAIAQQQSQQHAALVLTESVQAIARQRYQAGLATMLNVLAAETALLNERRQGVDLAARALDTEAALLRALGGGYRTESAVPALPNK